MELLTILPNLGIGVVAVLALGYLTIKNGDERAKAEERFLSHLDVRTKRHEDAMMEREAALRALEAEVRNQVMSQLSENTKVLERVIKHMDNH